MYHPDMDAEFSNMVTHDQLETFTRYYESEVMLFVVITVDIIFYVFNEEYIYIYNPIIPSRNIGLRRGFTIWLYFWQYSHLL
jgi:hypothetical protein